METKTVEMTAEELKAFQEFKESQLKKYAVEAARKEREEYKTMIDDYISEVFPKLVNSSKVLSQVKQEVMESFNAAIELKKELFKIKEGQLSHTFTNQEGTKRITVGFYTTDAYADTVNEGIAIVTEVISSLAKDPESSALVEAIMKLLSKDSKGTLKASRVIQLHQMADKLGNERLIEGVHIIEESYQPQTSKTFIRAEMKAENNAWINIPLGITEA